ncbi:MAG: hypothetical protein HN392_01115 [Anaerolineae bacterium]|jgi:hypothetical protein|nr:hypothetical protein [Anaerolineae bacterium]MBT7073879.1 hypothetical protein [Anaerolineae bacterium]MBT7781721.1 hypothetical protein [Anaerolineae bacterium]
MNKKILILLFSLSLIISACGSSTSDAEIEMASTAAVQTVEARFTELAQKNTPTSLPPEPTAIENIIATEALTPTLTAVPTVSSDIGTLPENALVANLAYETVPDGTVLGTGEYFSKSWTLQNNGTYTWHTGYKLIYFNGDRLEGSFEYPFFEDVEPGEAITLSIELLAPEVAGNYTGYWKIKSPSGHIFGVGEYNTPISVNIDVRNAGDIDYAITSVDYYMERSPATSCPSNVQWIIHAEVSVSGPMDIRYRFYQRESDGETVKQSKEWLRFDTAGTKTISNTWQLNHCVNASPRFFSLVILSAESDAPIYQYPEYQFINNCPDVCE